MFIFELTYIIQAKIIILTKLRKTNLAKQLKEFVKDIVFDLSCKNCSCIAKVVFEIVCWKKEFIT